MRHPLHDYTEAAGYFVTTVTSKRCNILGAISGGVFTASALGEIVVETWNGLPEQFSGITLDAFQLMPDHLHAILIITYLPLKDGSKAQRYSLPQVMQVLKRRSSIRINRMRETPGVKVWQEGYIDRVIRGEAELEKYRNYIQSNPLRTILGQ